MNSVKMQKIRVEEDKYKLSVDDKFLVLDKYQLEKMIHDLHYVFPDETESALNFYT